MINKKKVIILGTMHEFHNVIHSYSMKILENTIDSLNPDIICAELSEDQLFNRVTCNSKPEYHEVIIPLAKRKRIKIFPVQPNTPEGMKWGAKKDSIIKNVKNTENKRNYYKCYEDFGSIFRDNFLLKWNDFKLYQSEISDLFFESEYEYNKQLVPDLWELREEWNISIYNNINEVVKNISADKTILITIGLAHKFWLTKKFKIRDDIYLDYIENYFS